MTLQTINLTERNPVLREAVERKYFIHHAVAHKNMSQEDFDKELITLEVTIKIETQKALRQCQEILNSEVHQIKQDVVADGDLKRGIATILIDILKSTCNDEEIKGIMRQGYKIMRSGGI